jgi:hypothetical protein
MVFRSDVAMRIFAFCNTGVAGFYVRSKTRAKMFGVG